MAVSLTHDRTQGLVRCALCAALIAVCAWITIPAAVPFTLQTFAVAAALELLGGRRGTVAILVYLLLGAVGAPVFSGFRGGVAVLFGTTGGYLAGFALTGLAYWAFTARGPGVLWRRLAGLVCGIVLCYAFGTAWFLTVYARTSGPVGLGTALAWCVWPFMLPDAAKLTAAVLVRRTLRKHIG